MGDAWDPTQYGRFASERARPFFDLLALVEPRPAMRAVDLGCGPGELTAELHRRLGCAETIGVERSAAMLERAREHAAPTLRFELGDIADFDEPGGFDLVFSNAALHWVPDHAAVLARLVRALRPGGQLAVQMPANHDHPSHLAALDVAASSPFRALLPGSLASGLPHAVLAPERYTVLLDRLGAIDPRVRLEVYLHPLASREAIVEWTRGSLLTAYQDALSPDEFARFVSAYSARLAELLPDERPFPFTFKRLLLHASF